MRHNYGITFLLLAAIQLLICNYLNISAYITISLLPVLILCFPTRFSTLSAMLVAFATGRVERLRPPPRGGCPQNSLRLDLRPGDKPARRGYLDQEIRCIEDDVRHLRGLCRFPAFLHRCRRRPGKAYPVQPYQIRLLADTRSADLIAGGQGSGPLRRKMR